MPRSAKTLFPSLHTEGGLLPADILARIADLDRDLRGLTSEDYHLTEGERVNEVTNRAWTHLLAVWKTFHRHLSENPDTEGRSGPTRERWLLPFFQELGYGRLPRHESMTLGGKSYPISHVWEHAPIHLVGAGIELDRRTAGEPGAARSSPHSLVQEFLNHSDQHLWGLLSNGLRLRILRDNVSLVRQAYVEFDLEAVFEGELYADFRLLWLLVHQSRVEGERPEQCWLERWNQTAKEQGTRALDALRDGVETAIQTLGSGFLAHPANDALSKALRDGDLSAEDYYRALLRLVYRLIFLFVAEDRELLFTPDSTEQAKQLYHTYYSTTRLRQLGAQLRGSRHEDLYEGLKIVMSHLYERGCPELALPALGSYLWSPEALSALHQSQLNNQALLEAIRVLAFRRDGHQLRPVDYRNLGAEELGSVYESLLELHPEIHREAATFDLRTAAGHERKTTGSYYTPTSLITELLNSALDPVLNEAAAKDNPEQAILALKVCDPAVGSGHFLVAAAHRMARKLAQIRTGDEEPAPKAQRQALRDVVGHCLYAVDMNPMAVELCKVSLWMEALEPGKPLSFLDHHILCGNSLLGVTPVLIDKGIPDEVFTPLTGDDSNTVKELKKRNRQEHGGQQDLFASMADTSGTYNDLTTQAAALDAQADDTIEALHQKETRHKRLQESKEYRHAKRLADAWCAAFVWKKAPDAPPAITQNVFVKLRERSGSVSSQVINEITRLANQYNFFHWHLEFPDVFQVPSSKGLENDRTGWSGRFDVVLGNPPWERLRLEEKEFFASMDAGLAKASARDRKKMILKLARESPLDYQRYERALREIIGQTHIVRFGGLFPLTGKGNVTTHALFVELAKNLGRAVGMVVPRGIATQDSQKELFRDLVETGRLRRVLDFENRDGLFSGTHRQFWFCLVVIGAPRPEDTTVNFAFFLTQPAQIADKDRIFEFNYKDLLKISPQTLSCPTLRQRSEAALLTLIYERGVPIKPGKGSGSWGWESWQMFNETHEAGLLVPAAGAADKENLDRVYEAKLVHQFDHRYATYESNTSSPLSPDEKLEPARLVKTRYFASKAIWAERVARRKPRREWIIGYRLTTNASNERTSIFAIIPRCVGTVSIPVVLTNQSTELEAILVANLNSFVFDFATRLRVSSTNLNHFILHQLPCIPPTAYLSGFGNVIQRFVVNSVLELSYTAWDLEIFAKDCGWCGPPFRWNEERRFLLRCELDAAFFHLYLPPEKNGDWRSAKDEPAESLTRLKADFPTPRDAVAYIMDSFPIVRRKDEEKYDGDYRTKRVILEIYDAMLDTIRTGRPYQTRLAPPPADPSVAHPDTRGKKDVARK